MATKKTTPAENTAVETKAVEKRIPAEYQNALCGWADRGIGQRLYGKTKDIKVMLEELSKISYPLSKELKEFKKMIRTSFYFKDPKSII